MKLIIYPIFFIILQFTANAQNYQNETQKVIPPSPQAASFAKYGEIPVSTYNGLPNIDIPIYTIESGDIQVPITLSYHASGIKVNEEASWVGLGWTLNAGGVISRTIRNRDDFYLNSYFNNIIPDLVNVQQSNYMIEDCDPVVFSNATPEQETLTINHFGQGTTTKSMDFTELYHHFSGASMVPVKVVFVSSAGLSYNGSSIIPENKIYIEISRDNGDGTFTRAMKIDFYDGCFGSGVCNRNISDLLLAPGIYRFKAYVDAAVTNFIGILSDLTLTKGNDEGGTEYIPPFDLGPYANENVNHITYGCDPDRAYDFEPDQYNYNFLGYSGKFILKRNREEVLSKLDAIDFSVNSNATIWTVITKDGFKYTFDIFERYNDGFSPTGCIPQDVKTAWYLTKIESPKGSIVTFLYDQDDSYSAVVDAPSFVVDYFNTALCPNGGESGLTRKSLNSQQKYVNVYLAKIIFNNGEVIFDYNGDRSDLVGGKRLNAIHLHKNNEIIPWKSFEFSYDYFQGSGDTDIETGVYTNNQLFKRLKLASLLEKAAGLSKKPILFSYYEGSVNGITYQLPAKTSFARDHWGFYNGQTNNTTLIPKYVGPIYYPQPILREIDGANRKSYDNFARTYSLRKIEYPTGGSTEFEFDCHDFDISRSNMIDPDMEVDSYSQNISAFTGKGWSPSHELNFDNIFVPNPDVSALGNVQMNLTFISTGAVSNNGGALNLGDVFVDLYRDNENGTFGLVTTVELVSSSLICPSGNNSLQNGPGSCSYSMTLPLVPGKYRFRMYTKSTIQNYFATAASFSWQEAIISSAQPIAKAGGLRVTKMLDRDENGQITNARKFVYNYLTDEDEDGVLENRSYGKRMSKPHYLYYTLDTYSWMIPGAEHIPAPVTYCVNYSFSSNSVLPLSGSANGSAVGYDQVEVLHGVSAAGAFGVNGKTVYNYENHSDESFEYGLFEIPGIPRLASNRNGLLTREMKYEFDETNQEDPFNIVQLMENEYEPSGMNTVVYGMKRHIPVINDIALNLANYCDTKMFLYPTLRTDWVRLTSSKVTTFGSEGLKLISSTRNYYENSEHLQLTKSEVEESNGVMNSIHYYFPVDYLGIAGNNLQMLQSKNIVAPIKIIKLVNNTVIDGTVSLFNQYGQIQSIYKYESEVGTEMPLHDPSVVIPSSEYHPKMHIEYESVHNNIKHVRTNEDIYYSYIWGYDGAYPIAKAINAMYGEAAFTSFENGNNEGGWTFSGSTSTSQYRAGKRSHRHNSNITKSGLPSGDYIVSFWARQSSTTNPRVTVAGAVTNVNTATWTYYQVPITGTSVTITPNNIFLDELRIYPLDAQMISYTYEPLIGITSETGADGKSILLYEYDAFGRLYQIKDQDGNVLKEYRYNYKSN